MDVLLVGTEAKVFCLLMVAFLFIFKLKSSNKQSKKQQLAFKFLAVGILLAISEGFFPIKLIAASCGVCYALSSIFVLEYLYESMDKEITASQKSLCTLIGASLGILTYHSLEFDSNLVNYILVFALTVLFAVEQYNKIRVDNLTKLYNRYGMDIELREQIEQYKKESTDSFYIIACDLDNFKHINDTWGHSEGDRALTLVAEALSKASKNFDSSVFRIGGDEFVVITDKSDKGLAEKVTEAIQNELDKIDFRDDFDIRMSIGFALYDGVTPVSELLNNADKKLYEAKKISKQA